MTIPKGSYDGVPYQFFVYVYKRTPYKAQESHIPTVGSGQQYVDGFPFGYPLDRPIYFEKMFHELPNTFFYDTKVYHRDLSAINSSH